MTDAVLYEHHRRLDRQARRRVIGQTTVSGIALALGLWLIPEGGFVNFSAAKGVTGILSFAFGHLLLITGLVGLVLEIPRWLLNRGREGAWHIRLTSSDLLWDVPRHLYGRERPFHVPLTEIRAIERRSIEQSEGPDLVEFWLHPDGERPIRLKDYSGVSLETLALRLEKAGVAFERTSV